MWRHKCNLLLVAALTLTVAVTAIQAAKYDSYKLFEVTPHSRQQGQLLAELRHNERDYDFFGQPRPDATGYIMVAPNATDEFQRKLQQQQLSYRLVQTNVGRMLAEELRKHHLLRRLKPYRRMERLGTDRYYTHAEINMYLEDVAKRYPTRVFLKEWGRSHEGRVIKALTITYGNRQRNKNVVFMDGGFHAREWISPAAVLYIIEQLAERFDENKALLLEYDWVILPVVNPDGYEYTQLNAATRLWRKTRKPSSPGCIGTDPNRNFDFHWNENGASQDPCASTYAGPKAFSEPETTVVRDIMHTLRGRGIFYLTMHSFGNLILYPWGWTNAVPDTWEDLHEVAKAGADAIFDYSGTNYTIGSSTNVLYVAAGASDDYAFNDGFPIAFTMELPAGGANNFDPPPERIDQIVKETWMGVRAMAKRVTEKYPLRVASTFA